MNKPVSIWKRVIVTFGLLSMVFCTLVEAQTNTNPLSELLDNSIYKAPKIYWIPAQDQGSVKGLFYTTLPYKGKPTRAFAYLGIPKSDKPVPAMVLVHGGGGKAFYEWVKIWNDRGYAAISMSLEGDMPDSTRKGKVRHEYSGPARKGIFDDVDQPIVNQWMYHAVSDILLAHSLLASLPEVDANRIGVTGISWGGILSSLVSGVDKRFKCAIPVYGCGYLYESKGNFGKMRREGSEILEKKKFWDPARQFATGSIPTLWVNGDSDPHFSFNCTSRSFETTSDHAFLTIHPEMLHSHPQGWNPDLVPEIYTFADQILKGKTPGLGRITRQPSGRNIELVFKSETPITEATVYYLNEELTYRKADEKAKFAFPGPWVKMSAKVNSLNNTVEAQLPESALTYYVNLKDSRGCIISSALVSCNKRKQ